jgi:hypothetical protein
MSIPDLVLAKLAAGRPHDLEFVEVTIRKELVDEEQLRRGLELMEPKVRKLTEERLAFVSSRAAR